MHWGWSMAWVSCCCSRQTRTATRLAELLEPLHPRRPLVEMQLMGYCSAQICAHLAKQWSLPTVLAEALQYMHQPLQQPVFEPLTGVLHLAMWRAGTRALGWSERQLAVSFPAEVGLALGMDIDMVLRQASVDWHAGGEPDVIFRPFQRWRLDDGVRACLGDR